MLALGLIGALLAVVGAGMGRRRWVILGQAVVGAHLLWISVRIPHAWPVGVAMGVAGTAIATGGFLFGGKDLWRYVAWLVLSAPVGVVYVFTMGMWALYAMAKGP